MILSDKDFKAEVVEHNIVEPFIIDNLQPCSLDLTLGDKHLSPQVAGNIQYTKKLKLLKLQ